MKLFKSDFLDWYDQCSTLNEGDNTRIIYLKDVVGCENGKPILKDSSTSSEPSLLDYIDIEQTKANNPGISEDPDTWPVYKEYHYVVKCPNDNCRNHNGNTYSIRGNNLWNRFRNIQLLKNKNTAADIVTCTACRNSLKSDLRVAVPLSRVGGFANGQILPPTDISLADYLDVEKSIENNPHLKNADPETWSAFDRYCKYSFRCPECNSLVTKSTQTFYSLLSRTKSSEHNHMSVEQILYCASCGHKVNRNSNLITEIPEIWDRIPEWLFDDKSKGVSAMLSNRGYSVLYDLNKEQDNRRLPKDFLANLISKNADFRPVKYFSRYSEIILPFVCTTPECGLEYSSTIINACSSVVSLGCPACAEATVAGTSYSEIFLRETIQEVLDVELINTPKEGRFRNIDILFKYNGKLIGIEYDGGRWHSQNIIDVDSRKTQIYKDKHNIKFIRVREKGSAPFPEELAHIINISKPFIQINKAEYFSVIGDICEYIGYPMSEADYEKLLQVYKERSHVNDIKQKAISRRQEKQPLGQKKSDYVAVDVDLNKKISNVASLSTDTEAPKKVVSTV